MTTADLAFGRFVIWRGLRALIVDIQWRGMAARVQIRVAGGHLHWVAQDALTPALSPQPTMPAGSAAAIATAGEAGQR